MLKVLKAGPFIQSKHVTLLLLGMSSCGRPVHRIGLSLYGDIQANCFRNNYYCTSCIVLLVSIAYDFVSTTALLQGLI